jgi:signal transduction histidine kinase
MTTQRSSQEPLPPIAAPAHRADPTDLEQRSVREQERNRWLIALLTAQDDERRRIARELHDEMGLHLMTLGIALSRLEKRRTAAGVRTLRTAIDDMDRAMRRLAHDLHPAVLDHLGLAAAVDAHVADWSRRTGVHGDTWSRPDAARLPIAIESALYRIIQEALTNIARHARATHASVIIDARPGIVRVIVEDDGIGIEGTVPRDGRRLGLVGMRERAQLIGGHLDIESSAAGTSVFVEVPLAERGP